MELLKLRSFTVGAKISDADLAGATSQDKIFVIVKAMSGFVSAPVKTEAAASACSHNSNAAQITFLNSIVMPDPGMDDDSSEDDLDE